MRIAAFILGLLAGLSGFVVMILEAGASTKRSIIRQAAWKD